MELGVAPAVCEVGGAKELEVVAVLEEQGVAVEMVAVFQVGRDGVVVVEVVMGVAMVARRASAHTVVDTVMVVAMVAMVAPRAAGDGMVVTGSCKRRIHLFHLQLQ